MYPFHYKKGQSLIEIVFAIAVFTIGVVTIGYLILDSFASLRYKNESTQARFLASEGIEALRSIRDDSFTNLEAGVHGLVFDDIHWALSPSPDVVGKFTRTIMITDIDDHTKEVTAEVAWNTIGDAEKDIVVTTRLTNWRQTDGEAGFLEVDMDTPTLSASSTSLTGLALSNTGESPITLTGIIVQWDTGALLTRIMLQGTEIFGGGTPSVPSETFIDLADYVLNPNTVYSIDSLQFDASVAGTDFILTFILVDGTKNNVLISL